MLSIHVKIKKKCIHEILLTAFRAYANELSHAVSFDFVAVIIDSAIRN